MKHARIVVPCCLVVCTGFVGADSNEAAAANPLSAVFAPTSTVTDMPKKLCVELVAGQPAPMGQAVTVGAVCLETLTDALLVHFRAADGWSIAETQVAVASSLDGIPRAEAGVPLIGRFPHRTTHTPAVQEFTYSIPLAELEVAPGDEVLVAAHASVVNTTGAEEGGWGRGERFTPRGNPAMYFRYSITDA